MAGPSPAIAAGTAPATVLVAAPVGKEAAMVVTPEGWAAIVARYVYANDIVPFDGAPSIADCRAAHAVYMVNAPFELAGPIAEASHSDGRFSARTHIVATNCVTERVIFDRVIGILSDKPSDSGDIEQPDTQWRDAAQRQLISFPLPIRQITRVSVVVPGEVHLSQPDRAWAYEPGKRLRVFAHADGTPTPPITLTVAFASGREAVAVFASGDGAPTPQVGDYVEPLEGL